MGGRVGAARVGSGSFRGLSRALGVLVGAAVLATAVPAPTAAVAASAAREREPVVWVAPAEVNREPVGVVPAGAWRFGGQDAPRPMPVPPPVVGAGRWGTAAPVRAVASMAADDSVPAPGLGVQGHYGFEQFPLDESMSLAVNLGNGNLLVRGSDVSVNGPGVGLELSRFYNGLSSRTGAFGPRWSLSAGHDVGLELSSTSAVFRGPSGFRAVFARNTDGSYTRPSGLNADLVQAADSTFTLKRPRLAAAPV